MDIQATTTDDIKYNGFVGDIYENTNKQYNFDIKPADKAQRRTFVQETTKGIIASNEVSELFFSDINIDALQQGIRYGVYRRSNGQHVIGNQSVDELKVIMRSIYLQHCDNLPFDVVEQVRDLNTHVLNYAIPTIVKELTLYNTYRKDQATLPVPLDRGQNSSIKGSKPNEFKGFL